MRPYNTHKLQFRSKQCAFLGYSPLHKGFKCLDISTGRVYISRDVTFDETIFPFVALHSNVGAILRSEVLLLPFIMTKIVADRCDPMSLIFSLLILTCLMRILQFNTINIQEVLFTKMTHLYPLLQACRQGRENRTLTTLHMGMGGTPLLWLMSSKVCLMGLTSSTMYLMDYMHRPLSSLQHLLRRLHLM
jgi:hypothetical protein